MVLRLAARGGRRRCRSTECRDGALVRRDGKEASRMFHKLFHGCFAVRLRRCAGALP